jgi:hypothetical protein
VGVDRRSPWDAHVVVSSPRPPWLATSALHCPLMARRTIYVPGWLDRKLRSKLPAEDTVSAVACSALEARVMALEGCDHDAPVVCSRCHTMVVSDTHMV